MPWGGSLIRGGGSTMTPGPNDGCDEQGARSGSAATRFTVKMLASFFASRWQRRHRDPRADGTSEPRRKRPVIAGPAYTRRRA